MSDIAVNMTANENSIIEAKHVSKLFGLRREEASKMLLAGATKDEVYRKTGVTTALWDVNLKIPRGGIFVIIGLSGSGKSTMVRCFNRLNKPTSGSILFDGEDLTQMNSRELRTFRRNKIAMVFQSFGLMSHRDVLGNVVYGLEVRGVSHAEREQRAMEAISLVGLNGWEHKKCEQLSGGMRQRVGLARALANDPEVLLMDEPFSALDPLVRRDMQSELLSIQRKLGKTVIFITHDIDEAFKLGDTVAIMRDGRLVQVDTPERMSMNPADDYVRRFIETADRSRIMTVGNIMQTPSNTVMLSDGIDRALNEMRTHALSSILVVNENTQPVGVLTLFDAMNARNNGQSISDVMITNVETLSANEVVGDIMPKAAEAQHQMAVVDADNRLVGIVTKADILSSLM